MQHPPISSSQMKFLDPAVFDLNKQTKLFRYSDNHIGFYINRKSRFLMKDGKALMEKVKHIRQIEPKSKISLTITGPICSKTIAYLEDEGIRIERII